MRSALLMCFVSLHCAPVKCARLTPAAPHAAEVRPEQSYVVGPSVAHTYRLPICLHAKVTAVPALPPMYTCGHGTGLSTPPVPPPAAYAFCNNPCSWFIWP